MEAMLFHSPQVPPLGKAVAVGQQAANPAVELVFQLEVMPQQQIVVILHNILQFLSFLVESEGSVALVLVLQTEALVEVREMHMLTVAVAVDLAEGTVLIVNRDREVLLAEVVVPITQEQNRSILPGQIMDMVR